MEILFHAHHAVISAAMQQRAERSIRKLAARARHPVDAIVRFAQDGPERRVEIVLHVRRRRLYVAQGRGRTYGPALRAAMIAMEAELAHKKRTPKERARKVLSA